MNKYNSERYHDPTAYAALSAIEEEERALRAFRPIVYICSPYSGDVDANATAARRYSRFAVEQGYNPYRAAPAFPAVPEQRQLPRTPAWFVLRQRHHEQVQRGLGVWEHDHIRHGGGDRTCQVEELQTEIFYE